MMTRTRLCLACGVLAAVGAAAIAASGKPWLRVLIAPAWRTGALVSGSSQSLRLPLVVVVAFVFGFAAGFFGLMIMQSGRGREQGAKVVGANLVALYAIVALELVFYPSVASRLIEAAGANGSLGGEYPQVFAGRLLPAALLLLIASTIGVFWALRRKSPRLGGALLAVWLCQSFAFLGSVAWYVSPAGPGFR